MMKEQKPPSVSSNKDMHQDLMHLIQDYKFYTEGSLYKDLQKQLLIAFINQYPQQQQILHKELPQLKLIPPHIQALFLRFKEQIIPFGLELSSAFAKLKNAKSDQYSNLLVVRSKFQRVNILQLQRLVNKANEAKSAISSKDVILFLGSTGSGKTTNILRFLGYQLKQGLFSGISTLEPVEELPKQHASFITSPEATSITRYINAAQVPHKMYGAGITSSKKTFYFCDSPGFGDTGGVEVDKANGLGLIEALRGCRSLRVVLILPYHSITADRGSEIEKIAILISRIFSEVKEFQRSFTVLFNKVPKSSIKEVHNLIQSKTIYIKTDQETMRIVKAILSESANEDNYVYPLQTNYKNLFQSISKKDPIVQLKSLRYKSQVSTETAISIYIEELSNRIREDYRKGRYLNAKDQLQLLLNARPILNMDDVNNSLTNISTIIVDAYKKSLGEFQQSVTQYFRNGKRQVQYVSQIKRKKGAVQQIFKHFGETILQYDHSALPINDQSKKMAIVIKVFFQETNENQSILFLQKVKQFARQMQVGQLQKILMEKIESSFQILYEQTIRLLEAQRSKELHQPWQKLSSLHSQMLVLDVSHVSNNLLAKIRTEIQYLFDQSHDFIKGQILDRQNRLSVSNKWALQCKAKLSIMKDIAHLPMQLNDFTKVFNSCLKGLKNRCDCEQVELQNVVIDLLEKDLDQYVQAFAPKIKQLALMRQRLQFVQTLLSQEALLKTQRSYHKATLSILQNAENLCNFITDIHRQGKDHIESHFRKVKNNAQVLFKCCEAIKNTQMLQKIKKDIYRPLQEYMDKQKKHFSQQIKITSNIEYTIEKIRQKYKRITVFKLFQKSFGEQFSTSFHQVSHIFYEHLKRPFSDYSDKSLQILIEKGHLSHLPMALLHFQKFCTYSLGIDEVVGGGHPQIKAEQNKVKQKIKKYLDTFYSSAQHFNSIDMDYTHQSPDLKDLVRVLVAIMTKLSLHRYLDQQMNFDLTYVYERTKEQIYDVKRSMQARFEDIAKSENRIKELSALSTACNYFKSLEDILKSKEGGDLFHFRDLRESIDREITNRMNTGYKELMDELETKELMAIDTIRIRNFYRQICEIKTLEGQGKRNSIKSLLQKYQRKHMDNLKSMAKSLTTGSDTIFQNKNSLNDMALKFNEAITWQGKLKIILDNVTDQQLKQIGNALLNTAKLWIRLFQSTFVNIVLILADLNFELISKKLSELQRLETALYSISYFENTTPEDQFHKQIIQSFSETKEGCEIRLIEVLKHVEYAAIPIKKIGRRSNSQDYLSRLLKICFQDIKKSLEERYLNYQTFKLDGDFIRYYINFRNSQVYEHRDIMKTLQANVQHFMDILIKEYQQKRLASKQQAAILAQHIRDSIKKLPSELRQMYKDCIEINPIPIISPSQQQKSGSQLIAEYLSEYFLLNKESKLKYFLEAKYNNDEQQMIQQMFKGRAFQNFASDFYSSLQSISSKPIDIDIRRLKEEISANVQINLKFNKKYKELKQKQRKRVAIQKVDRDIRRFLAKRKQQ